MKDKSKLMIELLNLYQQCDAVVNNRKKEVKEFIAEKELKLAQLLFSDNYNKIGEKYLINLKKIQHYVNDTKHNNKMKYIIKFNNKEIGRANTKKECTDVIMNYLDKINYTSYYQRWYIRDGVMHVDYGAYGSFFDIYRSDNTNINNDNWV